MTEKKTSVYIDAFNLYYGGLKGTSFKWLDVSKLCKHLLPDEQIQKIKYFTALVSSRPDRPGSNIRQEAYFRALSTIPDLEIIQGHYQSKPKWMPTYASYKKAMEQGGKLDFVEVLRTDEKGSDVNLASHLLYDACQDQYSKAIVISNDSDLVEPIRIVKEKLFLQVGVVNPGHDQQSTMLRETATFVKKVRPIFFRDCQFPVVMKDKNGEFHRPAEWSFDGAKVESIVKKAQVEKWRFLKLFERLKDACTISAEISFATQKLVCEALDSSHEVDVSFMNLAQPAADVKLGALKTKAGKLWEGKITNSQFMQSLPTFGVVRLRINMYQRTIEFFDSNGRIRQESVPKYESRTDQ